MTVENGFEDALRAAIDGKTKPVGALGRIEDVAAQLARLQGRLDPRAETCTLTIFAADHGIAAEGVSAYPGSVTRQMLLNFLAGGAAANVFAATLGVPVRVVDAGIAGPPVDHPDLIARRIGPGTANALHGPAMSPEDCARAWEAGRDLAVAETADAAAFGDMGIGNTAAAALVAHKITGGDLAGLVGRGTGLDDAGLAAKCAILARAAGRTAPRLEARAALADYGGFEMAMMAGAMQGAAEARRAVLVDGVIATAAALCAVRVDPSCRDAMLFAHRSADAGHAAMLEALDAQPLLDLGMRLGEGTGALLAWPLLRAAAAMLSRMASFASAGVDGPA